MSLPSPVVVSLLSSKDVPERCMDVRMRIRAVASKVKLNFYAICDLKRDSCLFLSGSVDQKGQTVEVKRFNFRGFRGLDSQD